MWRNKGLLSTYLEFPGLTSDITHGSYYREELNSRPGGGQKSVLLKSREALTLYEGTPIKTYG